MGGINSLSGLNNVNVDFRPTVELTPPKKDSAAQQQPVANVVPQNAPQPGQPGAKSVVRQLDVLLMNAAGKSIGADIAANVGKVGGSLVSKGVLTQMEVDNLNRLANDAAEKLRALDKFSGRELAQAMKWTVEKGAGWNEGEGGKDSADLDVFECDTASEVGQAVQAAIDAQMELSEALGKFNNRLASHKKVSAALQEEFTELQFQCDRRATEIDSIVTRLYDLAQKNVVDGKVVDPKIQALLDAKFMELLPREAIMMHGTAEAFDAINRTLGDKLRPLAAKLDAFAADGSKILTKDEIKSLQADMGLMRNALANVRRNGIEVRTLKSGTIGANGVDNRADVRWETKDKNGKVVKSGAVTIRTEIDKSLLDAMEKVLVDVEKQIKDAAKTSVDRTVAAFIKEVRESLYPEEAPGAGRVNLDSVDLSVFRNARNVFMAALDDFAKGKIKLQQFDATVDDCIDKINNDRHLYYNLSGRGLDESAQKGLFKTARGLRIVKEQFKELLKSAKHQKGLGIAQSDVRRIMLGDTGISNVVEAKVHGFKPGDVDSAAEEQNIVSSKTLGSGNAGKTYLLKTKSGSELVFKPELDSRIGLSRICVGQGNSYKDAQKTANLNLATQDTAKAFGCEDLVVKYSVGSHDGQFGVFMEKAKGFTGDDIYRRKKTEGDGVAPAELKKLKDSGVRTKIQGQIAQKLNKLMWLDLITGQGDRHWNNYFIHIDKVGNVDGKEDYEVTVKAIDNDASFTERQVGLQKFTFNKSKSEEFFAELKYECGKIHGDSGMDEADTEYGKRVKNDPAITCHEDGTVTVDLAKAQSLEVKMALNQVLGVQSIALPEEIDREFYDKLMAMDNDPAQMKAFLDTLAPRISPEALKATEMRLKEAIAHAKKLNDAGKVYGDEQWKDADKLSQMPQIKSEDKITTSDGNQVTVNSKMGVDPEKKRKNFVTYYFVNSCPTYYTRDYLNKMFQ
jgi:hypothetical protein